jgi:thioredoxin 1
MAEKGRPRRLWLLGVIMALATGGAWFSTARWSSSPAGPLVVDDGRPKLLEFGMGVCEQCKKMRPVMERAGRELGDRVDVHILDVREERNEQLAERYQMRLMPMVVIVDGEGRELWRHDGFVEFDEVRTAVIEHTGAQK